MSDPMKEVKAQVEYFREIDRKFASVKNTEDYKKWIKTPLGPGKVSETREYKVVLYKNTPKQQDYYQVVEKLIEFKIPKRTNRCE